MTTRALTRASGRVLTRTVEAGYSASSLCVLACSFSRERPLRRSAGPNTSGSTGLRPRVLPGCRDRPGGLVRTPLSEEAKATTVRTFSPKPGDVTRQWHVIDAQDVVLGRLASQAANLLRGKHKPVYA